VSRQPQNAAASEVGAYLSGRHQALLIVGWLGFPLAAFFLWFAVGLAAFLRRTSAQDDGLPTYALIAAAFTAAAAWVGSALTTSLVFAPISPGALSFVWGLQALMNVVLLGIPAAVFIFACAHSMRRHGSAPAWLVWLGYVTAAGQAFATFGLFYPTGFTLDSAVAAGVLPAALLVLWVGSASVYLIVASGGNERAGAVSPA